MKLAEYASYDALRLAELVKQGGRCRNALNALNECE